MPDPAANFELALLMLETPEKLWLRDSLARLHPGHVWIGML
jgi:hypothetical protein